MHEYHNVIKTGGVTPLKHQSEVNFDVDKYSKPVYLLAKESFAQCIMNALFSKPGNIPSKPDRYVDIEQYLWKPIDVIDEGRILADLQHTCGGAIADSINSLSFTPLSYKGTAAALLVISITVNEDEKITDDAMAVFLSSDDGYVRYNYSFVNDDVPM